ncbi:UNVERIFIED_CONTAM: hypothetical protein FKN15_033997 [Acipenser sinensis]
METVGKFEFSRKDLIGHGAFAVVFKGRHKEKPDWEVAVKCINKKNLAKSQTLLGKEIKILKELKHDNIVALYDFQDWLSKFGYLPPPDPVTGQLQTEEALTKAIKAMQRFGGVEETGELGWVRTFPKESHLGHDTIRALMYYALKVWSDITPLNFHEVAGSEADIQIDFSRADHNDGYPFDGPGGTVAHAFFPGDHHTAGETHFDDDESWTFRSSDAHGMDLFAVAVHEFGHAIGLAHTSAIESVMRPYYQGPVGDPLKYDLPYEDKVRVWQLYAKGTLSEDTIRLFLHQIAGAMKVLQSKGIIHRDLKPQNILLSHSGGRKSSPGNTCIKIAKGTLSEDTIRLFLHQIAGAMKVLQSKGIIHRDLKPQNILLSHSGGRKSSPGNTCIKIADFGFARYLQTNMMAATLCGSPMYMAPEVIMSQSYDAKADLWSIGTIVFQCLTGKAPFQASSPQDLRLFYEKNKNLTPNDRGWHRLKKAHCRLINTDEFFRHPFLEVCSSMKKSAPVPMPSYPSSGSASSCSSSSTSHLASPPQSVAEMQQLRAKTLASPTQDSPGFLHGLKDSAGSSKDSSCDMDDFVMVPVQFSSDIASEATGEKPVLDSLMCSGSSLLISAGLGSQGKTPSPSPSFSNSPSPSGHCFTSTFRDLVCCIYAGLTVPEHLPRHDMGSRLHSAPNLSEGGANFCRQKIKKQHSDPVVHRQCSQPQQVPSLQPGRQLRSSPKLSELVLHRSPLPTILGSPTKAMPPFEFPKPPSSQNLVTLLAQQGLVLTPTRNRTIPDLKELGQPFCQQNGPSMRPVEENKGAFGRSLSAGRLSEMLLKAAFGGQVLDSGSRESLNTERPMDTAPPSGDGADLHSGAMVVGSGCPAPVVFTVGSPPSGSTPPQTNRTRMFSVGSSSSLSSGGSFSGRQFLTGTCADGCEGPSSLRYGFSDPVAASLEGGVTFEAPELPEETLMEQEHTETLRSLRFTLAFVHCVMEIAATKGMVTEGGSSVTSSFQLQESMVADQISLLSREWSYAEQLVLYMKTTELLSASLHTAMESIKQGKLCPSTTVKQGKLCIERRLSALQSGLSA